MISGSLPRAEARPVTAGLPHWVAGRDGCGGVAVLGTRGGDRASSPDVHSGPPRQLLASFS